VRIDPILNQSLSFTITETQKSELIEQLANNNDSLDNLKNKINDPMLEMAAMTIVKNQSGSTSLIQRRFNLGYNRACRVMDSLEKLGIVGASIGGRPRDVLIKTEEQLQSFLKTGMIYSKIDIDRFYQENKTLIDTRKLEIEQQAIDAQLKYEKDLIRASLLEQERKKNLHREVYRELIEEGHINRQISGNDSSRERIPQDVMDSVWNRDSGKCVKCGGQESLEFDHIIPFSKGGANTYRNLQILCKKCNLEKSNKIG
jgi:5-methylcytosine-specific restriction endonuclease McrA